MVALGNRNNLWMNRVIDSKLKSSVLYLYFGCKQLSNGDSISSYRNSHWPAEFSSLDLCKKADLHSIH